MWIKGEQIEYFFYNWCNVITLPIAINHSFIYVMIYYMSIISCKVWNVNFVWYFDYFRIKQKTKKPKRNFGQSFHIAKRIIKNEGISGLYRGYVISLCTYGSNSSLYWGFYYLYSELLESLLPLNGGKLQEAFRIGFSGILGSSTAIILTNPLDVVRTRFQLQVALIWHILYDTSKEVVNRIFIVIIVLQTCCR